MKPSARPTIDALRRILAEAAPSPARLKRLLAELADDDRAGVQAACAEARARLTAARREAQRTMGLYRLEAELQSRGATLVAGVDEVGRGALAGPLTAGAVILRATPRIEGLDDSKRLSPKRREELSCIIRERAVCFGIGHASAAEIDSLGVTAALKTAIMRALRMLSACPDHVVLDGLPLHVVEHETAVVKGDSKVAAIAAASIIAKVERDSIMRALAVDYPEFMFDINKGYGTSEHLAALVRCGPSAIHRRSFTVGGGTLAMF